MKVLLTGDPCSGKTTLLLQLVEAVEQKWGMAASEVRVKGDRIGFDVADSLGRQAVLARLGVNSPYRIGHYGVDLGAFEDFISPLLSYQSHHLLYLDEIGLMQLYSKSFRDLAWRFLEAENDFLGVVTANRNDPLVQEIVSRSDVMLCQVTIENRDRLKKCLDSVMASRDILARVPTHLWTVIARLGSRNCKENQFNSLYKLFNNAVRYFIENRIVSLGQRRFVVHGDTSEHFASVSSAGSWVCDCDLFNGRGLYAGHPEECSHLQAIQMQLSSGMAM